MVKLPMPVVCDCGFATMDAKRAVEHAMKHERESTLVAENVEVDMETLRIAQSVRVHPLDRHRAEARIVDAVINALEPEDRKRLEAYERGGNDSR